MKGLKAIMMVATIVALATVLSACERAYKAAALNACAGTAGIAGGMR